MPTTTAPVHHLDNEEVNARVSVLHHRKAQERFHQAQAALDRAADTGFADASALDLIDEYEDAKACLKHCENDLGKVTHIPKEQRSELEQQVHDKHERLPALKFQAQMTDADFRNWQQDQERSRIERETQLATASRNAAAPLPQMPVPEPARPVQEADDDDLGSRQVPARPRGGGKPSRPGAANNPAAGPAANRVADPSLAKGNEPAADARKRDTDKDLEPTQPRENSPQAEDERRTGVAKQ